MPDGRYMILDYTLDVDIKREKIWFLILTEFDDSR